jgi:AraC-like DNA-binding protein
MLEKNQISMIGHLNVNPAWKLAAHSHPRHELIVMMRGKMSLHCPDGHFTLEAGDVVLYPAGMPHAEKSDPTNPVESYFFQLTGPADIGEGLLRRHDHTGRLRQIIRWLHADQGDRDPGPRAERDALFGAFMSRLFIDSNGAEAERVRRVRAFVKKHMGERLTIGRLAKECGLSPFHFARTYRRLTGLPPMKDVRRMRLNFARDLIMTAGIPLKEIAQLAGFGNPYALSRLFRRHFGMPPGEFRRNLGQAE